MTYHFTRMQLTIILAILLIALAAALTAFGYSIYHFYYAPDCVNCHVNQTVVMTHG